MCIKPPFPRQVLKDVMPFYKPGLEGTLGCPIRLILIGRGMFPDEHKSRPCKWMRRCRDVWAMGAVMTRECISYLWMPLKRVSCTLSWMQMFSSPFMSFIFLSYLFYFKRLVMGDYLGMVTNGDNVTHKHFTKMRRLDRDESPFLLAMPPRDTNMVWWQYE